MTRHKIAAIKIDGHLRKAILKALELSGIIDKIRPDSRVALKPNFTYPYHKPGVTTSPEVISETVRALRELTAKISIVETEGGYGAWRASEAFSGHGVYELERKFGIQVINLNEKESVTIDVAWKNKKRPLQLPRALLYETDVFISMPVPKVHCMTVVSLGYKNQWGCIPDTMRLRSHHMFSSAIVAINRALRPVILADGTYFLDNNGPMEGKPVRMDLIIAGTSSGAFDLFVSELMGIPWKRVPHLKRAVELGDMPASLDEISFNMQPSELRRHDFRLKRTLRNYIALTGFKSRLITWLGYEAWFGRVLLHQVLYAVAGKPAKPREN